MVQKTIDYIDISTVIDTVIAHVSQDEDYYYIKYDIDDMEKSYLSYGIFSLVEEFQTMRRNNEKYVTESYIDMIMHRVAEAQGDQRFSELYEKLEESKKNMHTVYKDVPTITDIQKRICYDLDIYAAAVRASSIAAQHGKSWEPFVRFSCKDGIITSLSVSSYQGGDKETFTGSEEKIVSLLENHLKNILPKLLRGSTNSNPLVVMMAGDNSKEAQEVFESYIDEKITLISDMCVSDDDIFYPAIYDGYSELSPTMDTANYIVKDFHPSFEDYYMLAGDK